MSNNWLNRSDDTYAYRRANVAEEQLIDMKEYEGGAAESWKLTYPLLETFDRLNVTKESLESIQNGNGAEA